MFGDLMSFLLDCALAQITNESYHIISFYDLHKKIAKGKEWILLTNEDVNVDFVQYANILAGKIRKFISQHGLEAKEFPLQRLLSC